MNKQEETILKMAFDQLKVKRLKTTVEVEFADGSKATMELKETQELNNCEIGKKVVLQHFMGDKLGGIFKGIEAGQIILESVTKKNTFGFPFNLLGKYAEAI